MASLSTRAETLPHAPAAHPAHTQHDRNLQEPARRTRRRAAPRPDHLVRIQPPDARITTLTDEHRTVAQYGVASTSLGYKPKIEVTPASVSPHLVVVLGKSTFLSVEESLQRQPTRLSSDIGASTQAMRRSIGSVGPVSLTTSRSAVTTKAPSHGVMNYFGPRPSKEGGAKGSVALTMKASLRQDPAACG